MAEASSNRLLHYQQLGQGRDIILIHGLFGRLENLNMVAKELTKHYRVTSVDVRNHGKSFHSAIMDYPTMAQDIIFLMQQLDIEKADVLGHSMGGKIAMQMALTHPEFVKKLIVADIAPVEYAPHHNEIITGLKALNLDNIKQRKEASEQLAQYVDNASVRQFLLGNLHQSNGKFQFKCNIEHIANNYLNILKSYQGDKCFTGDTLFIKGDESDYILPQYKSAILKYFPNSRAKIIHGAGHWLHAEKTTAFNRSVSQFLAA